MAEFRTIGIIGGSGLLKSSIFSSLTDIRVVSTPFGAVKLSIGVLNDRLRVCFCQVFIFTLTRNESLSLFQNGIEGM